MKKTLKLIILLGILSLAGCGAKYYVAGNYPQAPTRATDTVVIAVPDSTKEASPKK